LLLLPLLALDRPSFGQDEVDRPWVT